MTRLIIEADSLTTQFQKALYILISTFPTENTDESTNYQWTPSVEVDSIVKSTVAFVTVTVDATNGISLRAFS